MSQQIARQVALITVVSTCAMVVALVVALGLGGEAGAAIEQMLPLAVVFGVALVVLLSDSSGQA